MTRIAATLFLLLGGLVLGGCANLPGPAGSPLADRQMSEVPPANAAQARAKVHVDLGMAYVQVARYDVALDAAKNALESDPGYAPAYHLMGVVYMLIEDMAAARENFQRALRIAPNDPEFNNSYGWFQCVNGQEQEGLERLALASRNPYYRTPTRSHTNAGLCYLRMKNDTAAQEQFERALRDDAGNTQALYHLAALAYRRAAYVQARQYLVDLHQRREPTAESVWLGLRTERRLGNRSAESSYAAQLRGRFATSPEYQAMMQGTFE